MEPGSPGIGHSPIVASTLPMPCNLREIVRWRSSIADCSTIVDCGLWHDSPGSIDAAPQPAIIVKPAVDNLQSTIDNCYMCLSRRSEPMSRAAGRATAYLGLGSNLGDRLAAMRAAVAALCAHPEIHVDVDAGVASLYETAPVGAGARQPNYYNSAVRVETSLAPAELLETLLAIETSLGRARRQHSSPPGSSMDHHRSEARIIDIDLLLYDDLIRSDGILTLPHPRLHERRFVLEPLAEIAGRRLHPVRRVTIVSLARKLVSRSTDGAIVQVAPRGWVHGGR